MKRFLIGQLARYGDCLFATVIAKQIKQNYPQSHITWAIASNFKSILENNPYIDEIWDIHIDDGDYYGENWYKFEREAEKRKENGDFDEIIYSQVCPLLSDERIKPFVAEVLSDDKRLPEPPPKDNPQLPESGT